MIKINANTTFDHNLSIQHKTGSAPEATAAPVLKTAGAEITLPAMKFPASHIGFAHHAALVHAFLWLRHVENRFRTKGFIAQTATFENKYGSVAFKAEFEIPGLVSGKFKIRAETPGAGATIDDAYDAAAQIVVDAAKAACDVLGNNIAGTVAALRGKAADFAKLPGHVRAFNPT